MWTFRVAVGAAGAVGVASAIGAAGCDVVRPASVAERRTESTVLAERFTTGRFARQQVWQPCASDSALVPIGRCGAVPSARRTATLLRLTQQVGERRAAGGERGVAAPASRLFALLDLASGVRAPTARAAVTTLDRLAGTPSPDPAALNDLAVASLALAEQEQALRPLLRALDAIERAAARDSSPPVLFNRALLLERLSLVESARAAWSRYVAAEPDAAWRREGAAHAESLARLAAPTVWARGAEGWLADPSLDSQLPAHARAVPQSARETGLALFGAWGHAVASGDSARARRALSLARSIGASLDSIGGDHGLTLAVEHVDTLAASRTRTRTLAGAYARYARGFALYNRGAYDSAAHALGDAERAMRRLRAPGARWAAMYRGLATINDSRYDAADTVLRRALHETAASEPALAGKIVWALGLSQARRGATEAAVPLYRDAIRHMLRARERENRAVLASLLSETLAHAGQSAAGSVEALWGLRLLAPYRSSAFAVSHLTSVAAYTRADTLSFATAAITSEALAAARAIDRPQFVAWAYREHARAFAVLGRRDSARANLQHAERWLARVSPGVGRDRLRADIRLVAAQLVSADDPRAAQRELLDVVRAYQAADAQTAVPNALYQAALASQAVHDDAIARALLDSAARAIESRRARFPSAEVRASYLATTEDVFDALITIALREGDPAAFTYLERSRTAAWGHDPRSRAPTIASVRRALAPGTLLLDYALLRDRTVVWAITHDTWRQVTIPLSRDRARSSVDALLSELGRSAVDSSSARARLFDRLLRPVGAELARASRLVVVLDRELSRIPLVALWDARRSRYLLEQVAEVRTLPNAAFASDAVARGSRWRDVDRALVVGQSAGRAATAGWEALPGADDEATRIAALYRRALVLDGASTDRARALDALPASTLFHFAGHAVADAEQPELSHLVFSGPVVVSAREIGALRLSKTALVVLSACNTLGARPTHAGAVAGIAHSFLRAGAAATVSSLWDVDDGATTELLVTFHERYRRGVPAAMALHAAQLQSLQSHRAAARAPRVWAAFIYTGP